MKNPDAPAFPKNDVHHANGQIEYGSFGVTNREYFAAKAMQGLMAADYDGTLSLELCATIAVKQADALLEALGYATTKEI